MGACDVKLSARHKIWLAVIFGLLYATGIAWAALHYGVNRDDGLETPWRIAETWTLRAHGAAAMATLIAFGSMLPAHVPAAWKLNRNVVSGIGMLATLLVLVATGWLLYYAAGESLRAWSSYLHMGIGIGAPLAVLWHLAYRTRIARACPQTDARRAPSQLSVRTQRIPALPAAKQRSTNP